MNSPLSFNSTENFRKKLQVRNLEPYKVDGSFSFDVLKVASEVTLVDYSVNNLPDVTVEQKIQEERLIKQNKFNPNGGFGDTIIININKNNKSNLGSYGFQNTIGSELENVGDATEKLLYVQNIYGPTDFSSSFGNTIDINKNLNSTSNKGVYGYINTQGSLLETFGVQKENELIIINQYGPDGNDSRSTVTPNVNKQTKANEGHYDFIDTIGSELEKRGRTLKEEQIVINQYGPEGQQSQQTINPNINKQTNANEGNYGPSDAISSPLELEGDRLENLLRVLNKFTPSNIQNGYGNSVLFPTVTIGSNQGDYDYVSNGPNITSDQSRVNAYTTNFFGPEGGFRGQVNPNINQQTKPNSGPYSYGSSSPNLTTEQSQIISYLANVFGPEDQPNGFGTMIDPNLNFQTQANKGEYDFTASAPNKTTEQSIQYNYIKNLYNTGEGTYEPLVIDEYFPDTLNRPYTNSDTTFSFVASSYSPFSILTSDNPNGSEGSLSNDSNLAKIAAKKLQEEFRSRVATELYQQTLGRTILSNSSVTPNSGGIGGNPSIDPFEILGVASNNVPLIQKNYTITEPSTIVGDVLSFTSRLSGLYSPYSIIPGEYFDYPERNFLSQALANPISAVGSLISNFTNKILSANIDSGSERFLANTSRATRSLLFDQLFFNQYRPDYNFESLLSPNLSSPKPNFYVGNTKNFVREVVSPSNEIPLGKGDQPSIGPVFDYGIIGKEYEGNAVNNRFFGINSRNFFDGASDTKGVIGGGTLIGNFTWTTSNNTYIKPGQPVGYNNQAVNSTDSGLDQILKNTFDKSKSSDLTLTDGSILDITQKLIDAGSRSSNKAQHVGNAINQVSKVFNDGYIEMTKGSRVFRYVTPTSVQPDPDNPVTDVKGFEYCRLFTKDRPYYTYKNLQKSKLRNNKGNIRGASYSVLDSTYNLNIAPMTGPDSTNIQNGRVKKYMFSLENLAWRTSNKPGFTVDDLPGCEIGPNGGRIMWFPPYDLSFDESSRADWEANVFLGRPEPIYTYKSTERTGTIKWKIVVDHPSIMNLLVKRELESQNTSVATKVIDSFIAGCTEYDIYDLLRKYGSFSLNDIYNVVSTLSNETLQEVAKELPNETPQSETIIETDVNLEEGSQSSESETTIAEDLKTESYQNIQLLFQEAKPSSNDTDGSYEEYFDELIDAKSDYDSAGTAPGGFANKLYFYNGNLVTNAPSNFSFADYIDTRKSSLDDVFSFAQQEYDTFKELLSKILTLCDGGNKIVLEVIGSANSNNSGASGYNNSLSKRRTDSVIKMITDFTEGDLNMKDMVDKKLLEFSTSSAGSNLEINEENYRDIDCSKPFANSTILKYSVQGMMCRRVKVGVKEQTPPPTTTPSAPTTDVTEQPEGETPNPLAADNDNTDNTQPQSESSPVVRQVKKQTLTNSLREGITKRLLRKLLSECDYFEMIREEDPMIYDGIKSRIKNFNPVFHSITPEGLNARLTFLQQCMRPGDTIPTAVDSGQGGTQLLYNDVNNSAFGSPPICILRIGDFFHTKIVCESLDISYEDAVYDLNPEGIGVQPMIASITMQIKFIGGHGLKEPVAQLQNSLSFNYYANTEVYDERATETEQLNPEFEKQIIEDIKNEAGVPPLTRPPVNDGGVTLGTITTSSFDVNTSQVIGQINYKENMNNMITSTENYINNINTTLNDLKNDLLWGGLILYTSQRSYSDGLFDWLLGGPPQEVKIFGKPVNYQSKVDSLFNNAKTDIENDLCPLIAQLTNQGFASNSDTRKVKRKLTEMVDARKTAYLQSLEKNTSKLIQEELNFIKNSDQINFVLSEVDGYKNKRGGVVIYDISGTTEVDPTSVGVLNTYNELKDDLLKIGSDLNELNEKYENYQIIPNGPDKIYNDNFNFDVYIESTAPQDVRFFLIFGKEILQDRNKFMDEVTSTITESLSYSNYKSFMFANIGVNGAIIGNQTTVIPNGRFSKYEKSKQTLEDNFKNFNDQYFISKFPNNKYITFNKNKARNFTFVKQEPINPANEQNLLDLWSTVDSTGNLFNLKKQMV